MLVDGSGVSISTTDHGGTGPALLLTHGAGTTQGSLGRLVPLLTPSFRVVTFDLRNHGESGRGPWRWDAVLADVEAVRAAYELTSPVVAGHSLGGMIAALYAAAYPDGARAAVNIDGHGRGVPEQYDGMSADEVAAAWTRLEEAQESLMPAASPEEAAARDEMMNVLNDLDLFALYPRVPVPLLIFNAHGDDPLANLDGMAWYGDVMAAYRRGLDRDLAALAASNDHVEIVRIDAPHFLVVTHPEQTARAIVEFANV